MNQTKQDRNKPPEGLAFRLRSSVTYQVRPDGQPVLMLSYPLKAVRVPVFWKPVMARLCAGGPVPIDRLARCLPRVRQETVEAFLNDLLRKGYVDVIGIPGIRDKDLPRVSVIIPVRNRPREIAGCLDSLRALDYPEEKLEIIVVDDASGDTTRERIRAFEKVRLIRVREHRQASFCRNLAAREATGEILAFIDSDCQAHPDWLRELVPAFRDRSLGGLGGLVDDYFRENRLDRYEAARSALKIGSWFKRSGASERFFYVPFCNFLVRRSLFLDLGGLVEHLHVGEDVDFCWRLQDSGAALEFRPRGRVFHKHRNRIRPFCFRRFDYGTSEPLLQKRHPDRVKTMFLPPVHVVFWMLCLLAPVSPAFPVLAGMMLGGDAAGRHWRMKQCGLSVGPAALVCAVLRSYLSFGYHLALFVSRYYLLSGLLVLPVFPGFSLVCVCLHLGAGYTEYTIKKAAMTPVSFLFFFSLDQLSYQAGVMWGGIRHLNLNPLLPRIVFRQRGQSEIR